MIRIGVLMLMLLGLHDDGWTWVSYEDFGWGNLSLRSFGLGWLITAGFGSRRRLGLGPGVGFLANRPVDYVGWAPYPPRGTGVVYGGQPIGAPC